MEANITIEELNALIAKTTKEILDHELTGTTTRKATIDVHEDHKHLIPVLEAIASLAVSKAESQVVAVSVLVTPHDLQFTLAENTKVSENVLEHVQELLAALKKYSASNGAEQVAEKLNIVKMAYKHSYPKLKKRFRNRIDEKLEIAFTEALGNYEGSALLKGAREVISALTTTHKLLEAMKRWYETVNPTTGKRRPNLLPPDTTWKNLIAEMDDVKIDLEDVLANEEKCKEWAVKLQGEGADPAKSIALYRWIQKISSHHRHINALLRYALSDQGRRELANLGALSVVGNIPAEVKVGVVHCECSLIVNLREQMLQANPPLNYIGVSKLSCGACHAWIQAYNATQQIQFYTQGTHGRWYEGWVMSPAMKNSHMFSRMKEIVTLAASEHATAGPDVRRKIALSDSTGAERWFPQEHRTGFYHSAVSRTAREELEKKKKLEPKE